MASLENFGDMVIQTCVLSNMTPLLWADPETLESPIVMVSMDTLSTLPDDTTMTNSVLLSFIISLCRIIHICISSEVLAHHFANL